MEEKTPKKHVLTEEGKRYMKEGLPEIKLAELVEKIGAVKIEEAQKNIDNFSIALNWAKKNDWVRLEKGFLRPHKKVDAKHSEALKNIENEKNVDESLLKELVSRRLVEEIKETELVKAREQLKGGEITRITPELIKTGLWREARLKPYNVESVGQVFYPGKRHILTVYSEKIRNIFLDMGFSEANGPLIESSFWNFDALYQPQDHPARDMADTFYMKNPSETKLPSKDLVRGVSETHENGGKTGSTGWQYEWNQDIAKKPILRTHTTAVSARMLSQLKPPAKIFCLGRVFRNETIDYKHLAEFTQVEGIVVDENVNFRNLLGYLKEFYQRMGFSKVRFRPAYFPYTEMSVEPEIFFEEKGEWMEMGGAGIFRPEVTKPLGIDCPVLAWGLSLERPIMLRLGLNDIRNFYYRNDLELLRKVNLWQ
jgi:phenylalanyl-tRNA synthetase alpha chain